MRMSFIFGKDYKRHGWFKGLILEKEFFNFMLKRKLLSDITDFFKDKLSVISSDIFKQVRKDLNDLILIRNKVAHGSIFYDGDREAFYIEYYEGRKKKINSMTVLCDHLKINTLF